MLSPIDLVLKTNQGHLKVFYKIFKHYKPNSPLSLFTLLPLVPTVLIPFVALHTPNTLFVIPLILPFTGLGSPPMFQRIASRLAICS